MKLTLDLDSLLAQRPIDESEYVTPRAYNGRATAIRANERML